MLRMILAGLMLVGFGLLAGVAPVQVRGQDGPTLAPRLETATARATAIIATNTQRAINRIGTLEARAATSTQRAVDLLATNAIRYAGATQAAADRATCGGARTCGQMTSCEQAYACLRAGRTALDRDKDGVPCESICPGG